VTESQHQIDFISAAGTIRLLDIGAIIDQEPDISIKQREKSYASLGAEWSENVAMGGNVVSVSWQSVRNHSTQAALRSYCLSHLASFPANQTGKLRMTVSGGEVWDIEDCVISSSKPMPLIGSATFETVTSYQANGGHMLPGAALTLYAGIPWSWILQDWDDLTGDWDDL